MHLSVKLQSIQETKPTNSFQAQMGGPQLPWGDILILMVTPPARLALLSALTSPLHSSEALSMAFSHLKMPFLTGSLPFK